MDVHPAGRARAGVDVTRSKWWWLLDIAAVVPLVAMVLSITIAAIPAYRIATNPQTAVGVVTAKRGNLLGDPPRFVLGYGFAAASGGEYRGATRVSRDVYDRSSVGDPFEVEYAADAPEYNRGVPILTGAGWFFALGVLVALVIPLVVLAWKAVRRLGADLWQLGRGKLARGHA
jgi:hypothetical protein